MSTPTVRSLLKTDANGGVSHPPSWGLIPALGTGRTGSVGKYQRCLSALKLSAVSAAPLSLVPNILVHGSDQHAVVFLPPPAALPGSRKVNLCLKE